MPAVQQGLSWRICKLTVAKMWLAEKQEKKIKLPLYRRQCSPPNKVGHYRTGRLFTTSLTGCELLPFSYGGHKSSCLFLGRISVSGRVLGPIEYEVQSSMDLLLFRKDSWVEAAGQLASLHRLFLN